MYKKMEKKWQTKSAEKFISK